MRVRFSRMCGGGSGVSGLCCLAAAGPGCGNSWADRADTDRTGFTHPAGGPWRQEQTSPNCSPDRCAGRPRCRGKGGRFGLLRRGRLVNERRSAYRGFAARGRRIGHWAAHDAAEKGIVSPVAARADILVVPNLEAGNMLAKQLTFLSGQRWPDSRRAATVPIILTSRADSARTRLASCALGVLMARAGKAAE